MLLVWLSARFLNIGKMLMEFSYNFFFVFFEALGEKKETHSVSAG